MSPFGPKINVAVDGSVKSLWDSSCCQVSRDDMLSSGLFVCRRDVVFRLMRFGLALDFVGAPHAGAFPIQFVVAKLAVFSHWVF